MNLSSIDTLLVTLYGLLALGGLVLVAALFLKRRRERRQRRAEMAHESEEPSVWIKEGYQREREARIGRITAPHGSSASVSIKDGRVSVQASGGARVEGVLVDGKEILPFVVQRPMGEMEWPQIQTTDRDHEVAALNDEAEQLRHRGLVNAWFGDLGAADLDHGSAESPEDGSASSSGGDSGSSNNTD